MRLWIAAAAAALGSLPTVALACSCLATDDPTELKAFAAESAKDAIALVEVETLVSYQESNGAGDRMRVVRTLAGAAEHEFRVERGPFPSSASCDLLFERGQRAVVILYPSTKSTTDSTIYRISGLCTGLMLDKPVFRDAVAGAIGASLLAERG